MNGDLGKNDPYRGMERSDTRPEFLRDADKKKEKEEKSKAAAAGLGAAERSAVGAASRGGVDGTTTDLARGSKGLFTGSGRNMVDVPKKVKGIGKISAGKMSAVAFLLFGVILLVVGVASISAPIFMIGNLDYNLQQALGFSGTVAILEKQAEYVTGDMLSKGKVPDEYANDLASAGINVGQVTAGGDFVRTNTYIANIEELDEVAAIGGGYYVNSGEGELAVLFGDRVVTADDFVAVVESDPKMYAAYSEAADISAKFYYSEEVDEVYKNMGLSRNAYSSWKSTGDKDEDQKSFEEILKGVLDGESSVSMAGCREEDCNGTVVASGDADQIVSGAKETASGNGSAAQLLNAAVSSEEPYRAASAFMAIEEPLQRTRIQGDGPANEVMTLLGEAHDVEYTDVNTGETITKSVSILETNNFSAAVSGGQFSKSEAMNFSRDRILKVTDSTDDALIGDTAISTNDRKKSDIATGAGDGSVSDDSLSKATDSVSIAISESNSDLFATAVGGNRIVEGGSFLSNKINKRVLGAMPSDEEMVSMYNHEVAEVLARKAEAERATLSPFDVSSPNTFLGSIAHNLATSITKSYASSVNGAPVAVTANAVANHVEGSIEGLFGKVMADGNDEDYQSTFGQDCKTANSVGSSADLYCTDKTTIYTGYMDKTEDYWNEKIDKDKYKNDYVLLGMDRETTVGVNDAEVCKRWREANNNVLENISDAISSFFGFYKACSGEVKDEGIATGQKFVMTNDNSDVKEYSGYTLYDTVSSLLNNSSSTAAQILDSYYAEHPVDNSRAGKLARISGLTKTEAQVALNYADYLTEIAKYDASTRYAFGGLKLEQQREVLVEHSERVVADLYCLWSGRVKYADVRNRAVLV